MKRIVSAFMLAAALLLPAPVFAQDAKGVPDDLVTKGNNVDPVTGLKVKDTSIVDYVNDIYYWAAIFGGLLAVIMLIYAGYRYMTSYGDPEKISDAKDIIEKALMGLALLILAALILTTINPQTTNPKSTGTIDFTKPKGR